MARTLDSKVVALFLSMSVACLAKPMGYDYPTPKVPFIEGTTVSTTTPPPPSAAPDYDQYDPEDIPQDQAAPAPDCVENADKDKGRNPEFLAAGVPLCETEQEDGYEYPVPENPLTLPTKPTLTTTTELTLPECIINEEKGFGENPSYLEMGVPLCPEEYEDYDPSDIPTDQAEPAPDCVPEDEKDEAHNTVHINNGIPICPSEEQPGYEYPVPEIPFTLPPKQTTTTTPSTTTSPSTTTTTTTTTEPIPECINAEEQNLGKNP